MTDTIALFGGAAPRAMFHAVTTGPLMLRGPQVTYNAEGGDGGGALTIEQATSAILGAPEAVDDEGGAGEYSDPDPANAGGAEDEDFDAAPSGDEGSTDEGDDEPLVEGEADADPEPVAALEPPAYWAKDAKAKFAALDPELQAVVLAQEGPREAAAAKAKADAATEVQAARTQAQGVVTLAQELGAFLPEAIETFQQRWGEPDWEATIRQYGAEDAAILKARYEKEQGQLQQLAQKTQTAQQQAHQTYMLQQFTELATLDPELAPDVKDPRKGSEKRQEVTKYLLDQGVAPEGVAQISAVEMTMARKAMLWDQAQAAAKARPKPAVPVQQQQRRATPKPGARPAGSAAPSPQSQGRASVQNSFNAKPSVENAVALLLARSKR